MRKKIAIASLVLILAVIGYLAVVKKDKPETDNQTVSQAQQQPQANLDSNEISKYTIDNQESIYFIVNKKRPLGNNFVPKNLVAVGGEQLRSEAATATNSLINSAKKNGQSLRVLSGYRSYVNQTKVYGGYVKSDGQAKADTYSARPGHSEHQTGLAVDLGNGVCDLKTCFGDTAGGKWLAEHAHEYGFIIRYQNGKESLTGYSYEPWHLRYVGNELAGKLHASGQTMEQFFGLAPAASY